MSLQVEKLENNMAKLTIEVPANDLEKALQSAYIKQKNKIAMPGFRKGKVPRQMIEKMYGPEIFYDDAANALIPKAYSEAYDECDLEIVSRPEINIVQIEKGKSFIFTADVATKPEVKLGEYKGLEVDKVSTRVTQKEVDAKIQEEAEKNAREVVVTDRPVADGDEVILDFEGFVDGEAFEGGKGENYPLTIGSGSFIPGFEEQLVGAEAEKEVEVKVIYPEDYHAEELKGKEAVFKCTVHEIKAKELPEIDDEFAAEVSEFDTLEEYKADVKAKIKEQKAADGKRNQEDQAVEQAVKNAEYEIPQPMIDTQTTQMVEDFAQRIQSQGITLEQYFQFTGLTAEKMMEDMKPQAIKRIETRLVLEAIAKAENIEITDEKVDEELAKMAESYKMEVEKLKEFMGENEKKQMKEAIIKEIRREDNKAKDGKEKDTDANANKKKRLRINNNKEKVDINNASNFQRGGDNRGGGGKGPHAGGGQQGAGGGNNHQGGNKNNNNRNNNNKDRFKNPIIKQEVSEEDVAKQVKETLARLTSKGKSKTSKYRKDKRDMANSRMQEEDDREMADSRGLNSTDFVTVFV